MYSRLVRPKLKPVQNLSSLRPCQLDTQNLRIGIDGRNLIAPFTGIGRYIVSMSKALAARGHQLVIYVPNSFHPTVPPIDWAEIKSSYAPGPIGRLIWGQTVLPQQAGSDQLDIFWGPAHRLPILQIGHAKKIITIHDFVSKRAPETMNLTTYFGEALLKKHSIGAADCIFVDSASTRRDLFNFFPNCQAAVHTIYLGYENLNDSDYLIYPSCVALGTPYFLFVGTLEPRKNLPRLLEAWRDLGPDGRKGSHLVIVGRHGWGRQSVDEIIQTMQLGSSVKLTGFISDDELRRLYRHSIALLMPSLYEGFGLPLIEAQSLGTSVLTSNISSMPEVVGPEAILVDPRSVAEIREGISLLLKRGKPDEEIRNRSKLIASKFSWSLAAERAERVFLQITNGNPN